jgi:hypothetical protein
VIDTFPDSLQRANTRQRWPTAFIALALAWGLTALGGVYAWAYVPLVLSCAIVGLWACWRARGIPAREIALAALVPGVIGLQLIPLPLPRDSGAAEVLRLVDVGYAAAPDAWHPVSIAPRLTAIALFILIGLTAWTLGTARLLKSPVVPATVARLTTVIGAAIALEAVAQKAMFNGKIYWVWESAFRSHHNYFGPFVNRNHFAGWMVLALPLTAAYLCAQLAAFRVERQPGWRQAILSASSPQSSRLVLTAAAAVVMAVALVWSMSRSGIAAAIVACLIVAAAAAKRMGATRGAIGGTAIVLTLVAAVMWKGGDTLASWYGTTNTLEWRVELWKDTRPALEDFAISGSGLNTYGTLMLVYPQTDTTVHAQQAHNDYLQLAVEGGALVCLPALLLVFAIARTAGRRLREPQAEMTWWIRMGAVAGICGIAVQEITDFSLQIPGVAFLFATCVAIAIHAPATVPAAERQQRRVRRPEKPLVTVI